MTSCTRDEVFQTLNDLFADVFDLDDGIVLQEATTAESIEEWDSLSHIRLIVSIEREYSIKFSNAEIEGFKSVGDLVDSILVKVS